MQPENLNEERLEDDDILDKVPNKYRDLYDSDDFEKFTYKNREWDWWLSNVLPTEWSLSRRDKHVLPKMLKVLAPFLQLVGAVVALSWLSHRPQAPLTGDEPANL
jgi:hypothetical protein